MRFPSESGSRFYSSCNAGVRRSLARRRRSHRVKFILSTKECQITLTVKVSSPVCQGGIFALKSGFRYLVTCNHGRRGGREKHLSMRLKHPMLFAFPFPTFNRFPFIMHFFTFSQSNFGLNMIFIPMKIQRHNGKPLFLNCAK